MFLYLLGFLLLVMLYLLFTQVIYPFFDEKAEFFSLFRNNRIAEEPKKKHMHPREKLESAIVDLQEAVFNIESVMHEVVSDRKEAEGFIQSAKEIEREAKKLIKTHKLGGK